MKQVFLILILTLTTIELLACRCAFWSGIDEVDHMIIGKVKNIEHTDSSRILTIKVKKSYKGTLEKGILISISTSKKGSSCATHFIPLTNYALYCHDNDTIISTGFCTKTHILLPFQRLFYKPRQIKK